MLIGVTIPSVFKRLTQALGPPCEITKNDFGSSIFVGKPVYIYTKVIPFIKNWKKIFTHEEMAQEILSAPL